MDTKKTIVVLLILTIILSILTIATNMFTEQRVVVGKTRGIDTATVRLFIESGQMPNVSAENKNSGNVGLNVEGGK